jgi:hypothetical protein
MSLRLLQQVRSALNNLNPSEVESSAARAVQVLLNASTDEIYTQMEDLFLGDSGQRARAIRLYRLDEVPDGWVPDFELAELGVAAHGGRHVPFDPVQPRRCIDVVVDRHDDVALALARNCTLFRPVLVNKVIQAVARENGLFAVATSAPSVIPVLSLPFAVGEFASDTAFLTMNQIRMGFLIAAAHARPVGYSLQKKEIASVIASAFGWRALARMLVGKIPFGGGIAPKAAIAYAATYLVGKSLERYYRTGVRMKESEQKATYQEAYQEGVRSVRRAVSAPKV